MTIKLLLVADSDSQLLACQAITSYCEGHGAQCTVNAIPREGTPTSVLQRLQSTGPLWTLSLQELLSDRRLDSFDGIGVYLTGSKLSEFRSAYHLTREKQKRPLRPLFCGFNGVVLERFEEAIAWRLGYDLICLNGPRDQARLEMLLRHTPFANQRTVLTGLARQRPHQNDLERPRRMVFAEQVVMPAALEERRRLVRILARLARRSPQWELLIKPRVAPHESTFHAVDTHISHTLQETLGSPPANLKLSYAPLPELLSQSRLLSTVSSTALFDALDMGCKAVVMNDFGVRQDLGGHFFAGSGLLRSLASAEDLDRLVDGAEPNQDWLHWVGYHSSFSPANLLHALDELRSAPRRPVKLDYPGYVVNAADLSTNQLRRGAEIAIRSGDQLEAIRLLEMAQLQRPDNRNIRKRLATMRLRPSWLRRLALLVTPRFRL